jgi:hypothetical protein
MGFLTKLLGGGKEPVRAVDADESPCMHEALMPRWDRWRDVGSEAKAVGFTCDACHQFFTKEEGLAQISRRGTQDELRRWYEGHLGEPVCFFCHRTGDEFVARIPFIGDFADMTKWWECRTKKCGLWVCQHCVGKLDSSPSRAVCPRCRESGFWQRWAPLG